ncbi:MAG: BtrH N-terminal domain-containing protein [Prevotella sp.]|nr:BtrH N-terminal domain-containing protein [Prevotella sp.]
MKVKDVPQDLKYYEGSHVRDVNYAVDDDGKYQVVLSDGWSPKTEALELALEEDVDKEERSKMKMQIQNDFKGFELPLEHRPAAHCENGTISSLLRYHGIDLSEPMIFGLASGLFFTHITFIKMGGLPVTSFRTFPGVLFKRITKLLGIKTTTHRFFSPEKAMQTLDKLLLEQKTPVGCVVGMYELPYVPVEYRFRFNGHNICVIGKDEEKGQYSVLDSNVTQKETISYEDLAKVRFPKGGVYPLMGQMYWIKSVPKQLPDLNPLILKAIHKTCWYMTSQPKFIRYVGANGILYLSECIRTWEEKKGRRKAALNLAQVIRMLEEIGTGGAGFRFVYGAFLQEAAERTGIQELNEYSKRITEIGDMWREFAYKASRMFKKRAGETFTYDDLGDLLQKIGEKERKFFEDLDVEVKKHIDR